ncbi:YdiK family protein [Jeotgalibacillus sp. ET6]|uniref:YdiK family protein n=1 Tax=Jeotgalibacillus sp. ET6 TaxID=3037260 RepID=UPI00241875CC|nr:YdiK family protein [Jeotgalibacillus sp. ET6]MDG5473113.1 YdiK family protein [Jeotgalibacillus sp. ET6]
MRKPLTHGITYILLGAVFTYFAINTVNTDGWGFFAYLFILFATYDIGSGIRLIGLHFRIKKHLDQKK